MMLEIYIFSEYISQIYQFAKGS